MRIWSLKNNVQHEHWRHKIIIHFQIGLRIALLPKCIRRVFTPPQKKTTTLYAHFSGFNYIQTYVYISHFCTYFCIHHPIKTITDADYADDIALLANTPNQAETLLHSLERAAAGIGFHVNAHKTEFLCALIRKATSPH